MYRDLQAAGISRQQGSPGNRDLQAAGISRQQGSPDSRDLQTVHILLYPSSQSTVFQAWLCVVLLCLLRGSAALFLNCGDDSGSPIPCTSISQDKLLERVLQHAEFIYRITEETCTQYEELYIPYSLRGLKHQEGETCTQYEELYIPYSLRGLKHQEGGTCTTITFPNLGSKTEVQQISDKKLLHSVLILAQSWVEPLTYLQSTMKQDFHAPETLTSRLSWVSDKLSSLEQGVVVLISQMVDEGDDVPPPAAPQQVPPESHPDDSTLQKYNSLMCLKKDAHKMETLLKLLKCRQTDKHSCTL